MPTLLARKFGIEMEGYMNTNPRHIRIANATLKRDGSLANSHWDDDYSPFFPLSRTSFGVEVVSPPSRDLDVAKKIFADMQSHGWSVDERAGTHVHIDISDFNGNDKAKLLRFCKGIERIIFMFVKGSRADNQYCRKLDNDWKNIFKSRRSNGRHYKCPDLRNVAHDRLIDTINFSGLSVSNVKYNWLNIFGSRFPTAEFRLFHAVESVEEVEGFILMAHNIVELVKNCSVEQLEFIILSLYSSNNVQEIKKNFFEIINMSTNRMRILGYEAEKYLRVKMADNAGVYDKGIEDSRREMVMYANGTSRPRLSDGTSRRIIQAPSNSPNWNTERHVAR